jgi:hypothetical protein
VNKSFSSVFIYMPTFKKLPSNTHAGFDLTTHNSAGGDDTTWLRRAWGQFF